MKITVDTNFLVSATQWNYSVSHKLLIEFIEKDVQIFTTKDILEEFSKVLIRDFQYTDEGVSAIIGTILFFINLIETTITLEVVKDDPEDNKILECALESDSEYILTYDKHLLKIGEYRGIKIIRPEEMRGIFLNE